MISPANGDVKQWGMVLWSMLYIRFCEMKRPRSLVTHSIVAFTVFLLLAIGMDSENPYSFWRDTSDLFIFAVLPVYCLLKGGDTLRSALRDGSIEYLWTRPASRAQIFMGCYANAGLSILGLLLSALIGVFAAAAMLGNLESAALALRFLLASSLLAIAFAAIASAISSWSSKFMVLGFLYFSFIELGLGNIPTSVRNVSVIVHAREILRGGQGGIELLLSSGSLLLIAAASVVAGAIIFSLGNPMPKSDN